MPTASERRRERYLQRDLMRLERRLTRMGHPPEPEPPPAEKLTFLQRLGDTLSGPLYGVVGGLRSFIDPESEQARSGFLASVGSGLQYTPYGLGLAGRPGLSRSSFQDVLHPRGYEPSFGSRALGFGMDVIFDPLTYVTMGYGGAASAAQKALTRSGSALRLAEPGAHAVAADALAMERAATMGRAATAADRAEALAQVARDRGGLKFMGQTIVPASALERTGLPALKQALTTSPAARPIADIVASGGRPAQAMSRLFFREGIESAPGGGTRAVLEPRAGVRTAQVGLSKIAAGFQVHPRVRELHRAANAALTGDIAEIQRVLQAVTEHVRTPEEHMVAIAMRDAPGNVAATVTAHPRFAHMSPAEIAAAEQRVQPVVDMLRQIHDPAMTGPIVAGARAFRPFAGEMQQAGLLNSSQADYIAHRYFSGDPRTQEVIARFAREEVPQHAGDPSRLHRRFNTMLEAMQEGLNPKVNLLELEAERMLSGYRNLRMTQFLDALENMGPEVMRDIPQQTLTNAAGTTTVHMGIAPPGFVAADHLGLPQLAQRFPGRAIRVNEARYVVDQFKPWMSPDFIGVFDQATRWWKALATVVNPAFHTRNAVGNIWNMWLVGFRTPTSLADAFNVQRLRNPAAAATPAAQRTIQTPQGPLTFARVAELAGQQGIGANFAVEELRLASTAENMVREAVPGRQALAQKWQELHQRWPDATERWWRRMAEARDPALAGLDMKRLLDAVAERATREAVHLDRARWLAIHAGLQARPVAWKDFVKTFAENASLVRRGRQVGNAVEDNARLALFIDGLKQGLGAPEAAARVKQALFDYGDLAAWEPQIRKAIPFWKWSRENIPLQIMALMKAPEKVGRMFKVEAAIEGGAPDREKDAQLKRDWMRQIISPKTPLGYARLGLPSEDLGGLSTRDDLMGKINPLLKMPFEIGINRSFFYEQPIVPENLPPELAARRTFPLMQTLSPEWANWGGVFQTPYGETRMEPRVKYALEFARPVQEIGRVTDPGRPLAERLLHFTGPVRFSRADEEQEKKNALYERRKRLQDTYRGYRREQRKMEEFRRGQR